jgi:hypothetical protein
MKQVGDKESMEAMLRLCFNEAEQYLDMITGKQSIVSGIYYLFFSRPENSTTLKSCG